MIRSLVGAALLQAVLATARKIPNPVVYGNDGIINLSSDGSKADIVVLDYGQSVEGHPTFEVLSSTGDTSGFELTFAESKASLNIYMVSALIRSYYHNIRHDC